MCGITFICDKLGSETAVRYALTSIEQLQNRGYDSYGISYYDATTSSYISRKHVPATNELFQDFRLQNNNHKSNYCMAHTRWATHGGVNIQNTHPHTSNKKLFTLIHNGIIENFSELKKFCLEKGFEFHSETDSEVIVNLIEYFYGEFKNIKESIRHTLSLCEGTYGLVIQFTEEPGTTYFIRKGSPLLIGENSEHTFLCSEAAGFMNSVDNYLLIPEMQIYTIDASGYCNLKSNDCIQVQHHKEINTLTPAPYPHWTLKEIMEQDESLLRAINYGARINSQRVVFGGLFELIPFLQQIENIILIGCGTSLHACQIGSLWIRTNRVIPHVYAIDAAEFQEDNIPVKGQTLLIVVSQSGETMDVKRVLNMVKDRDIYTLGIVNTVSSLIARETHCGIYMNAGREVGVASTKSFTSSLLIIRLLSLFILENLRMSKPNSHVIYKNIDILSEQIRELNKDMLKPFNKELLENISKDNLFILGKNTMEFIAKEIALKMKEICYIHAEGYSGSALKHGPFALLYPGFPVILIIHQSHKEKMINVYQEIKSRGAYVLVISDIDLSELDIKPDYCIHVPKNDDFQEIVDTVALQHLCYQVSLFRGINPDTPRNLAKVVTVE